MRTLLVSFSFVCLLTNSAPAQTEPCATARAVLEGLLYWQRPEHTDLARAGACFNLPVGKRATLGGKRAKQLLAIFDAQGLLIKAGEAPADPSYLDPGGLARFQPFAQLADVYIEKIGAQWLWSETTVQAIPRLYHRTFVLDVGWIIDSLPSWMRTPVFGVSLWQVVALLAILLLALLCRGAVRFVFRSWVQRFMRSLDVRWGAETISRVGRPIGTLAGAAVAGVLLPLVRLEFRLNQIGLLAVRVVVVFSVVWAVYRMVDLFGAWLSGRAEQTKTKLDDQLVPLVTKALKAFIIAIGAVFVLQNLNVDVAGLLAGLGLGGLAFALAAKDTVANLFGSATIFGDRPFQVGDWVLVGEHEGTVERIGFRSTRLRTFYNSLITIPNAKVSDSTIDNLGERQYRRYKNHIGVSYDTTPEQIQAFVEGIRAIVQANPSMRKDYYEVHFNDFGPSSLDILVYVFFKVPSWSEELRQRHNFLLEIIRLARELEVEFAFPTQTLHVATMAEADSPAASRPLSTDGMSKIVKGFGPDGDKARPDGPKITGGFFAS